MVLQEKHSSGRTRTPDTRIMIPQTALSLIHWKQSYCAGTQEIAPITRAKRVMQGADTKDIMAVVAGLPSKYQSMTKNGGGSLLLNILSLFEEASFLGIGDYIKLLEVPMFYTTILLANDLTGEIQ